MGRHVCIYIKNNFITTLTINFKIHQIKIKILDLFFDLDKLCIKIDKFKQPTDQMPVKQYRYFF